jgi:hypothetical protein
LGSLKTVYRRNRPARGKGQQDGGAFNRWRNFQAAFQSASRIIKGSLKFKPHHKPLVTNHSNTAVRESPVSAASLSSFSIVSTFKRKEHWRTPRCASFSLRDRVGFFGFTAWFMVDFLLFL